MFDWWYTILCMYIISTCKGETRIEVVKCTYSISYTLTHTNGSDTDSSPYMCTDAFKVSHISICTTFKYQIQILLLICVRTHSRSAISRSVLHLNIRYRFFSLYVYGCIQAQPYLDLFYI